MAAVCDTTTIGTTSTTVDTTLEQPYVKLYVKNLDPTNIIWIDYITGGAAIAEDPDNVPVMPRETVVLDKIDTFTAIAETSACKLHFWGVS